MGPTATTRRTSTALVADLLSVAVAAPPATALRLVPVGPPAPANVLTRPLQEPSPFMSLGMLAAHPLSDPSQPQSRLPAESSGDRDCLMMTLGRLAR